MNPEGYILNKIERKNEAEFLRKLLSQIAEDLKHQGIELDEECRIKLENFEGVYKSTEIENDKQYVERLEKEWRKTNNLDDRLLTDGERLEALKTIIFYKFLKDKFIIVRSSRYDDIKNKIDNIIIEKERGNIVCAFDEVSTLSGLELEKKKEIFLRNNINGATIKYGFTYYNKKLILGKINNVPIFYLALTPSIIKEGIKRLMNIKKIKNLNDPLGYISEYDKKLWNYFLLNIQLQISRLNLEKNLNKSVKDRISKFEESLKQLNKSID